MQTPVKNIILLNFSPLAKHVDYINYLFYYLPINRLLVSK